jgi:hypothetical protein
MLKSALVAVTVCGLAGCVSTSEITLSEPAPTNYREIIAAHVRATYFDPYSVRDASIARPRGARVHVVGTFKHEEGWGVCVRANSKDRMGAYTGLKQTIYIINSGTVLAVQDDQEHFDVRTGCQGAVYEPFPEIELITPAQAARPSNRR